MIRKRETNPYFYRIVTSLAVLAVTSMSMAGIAMAQQPVVSAAGARVTGDEAYQKTTAVGTRAREIKVYSPSMRKEVYLHVILAADRSVARPTYYLLNGAGGGEDAANWQNKSDIDYFMKDKDVNVVTPVGGAFSYYTDWEKEDPNLGLNKWTTFLTKELPPVLEPYLGASGKRALGGLSMAGSAVLDLAEHAPGFYDSVVSMSGCAQTATAPGVSYVKIVTEGYGGGDTDNMWGPVGGKDWADHDATINAEKLRGTNLYISVANGLPGKHDQLFSRGIDGRIGTWFNQAITGGVLEASTHSCTVALRDRLDSLGISATYNFKPAGTHSWGYWQDDLHDSWPQVADSIGA